MKKLLYIYNPNAGRQRSQEVLAEVLSTLSAEGYLLSVIPTSGPGDALAAARDLAPGHDRLVCCGGDGTLNEVVSGLLQLEAQDRPVVGYLPMGSANDFSRSLNLPKSIAEQAKIAASGTSRVVDMGDSSGHPFTYVTAFGLFTEVSYSTPQSMKNILGHFAYLLEGAGQLMSIPSYHMTITADGGQRIEGEFIYGMVGNTVSVGGVMSLPKNLVKFDDGQFEVLLVRKPKHIKDWQDMINFLSQLTLPRSGAVEAFCAKEIHFHCDRPVAWTVDGEFGGERIDTVVKVLPKAIQIAYNP